MRGYSEALYTPKGAGHTAPDRDMRGYSGANDALFEAFRAWIDSEPVCKCSKGRMYTRANREVDRIEDSHRLAMELLPELGNVSQEGINSVFIPFIDHPNIEHAGIFISAAHEKKGSKDVSFSTREGPPISRLGYRFGRDRILIVRADSSYYMGDEGEGTFVNYGSARSMGNLDAPGLFINMGKVEESIGGSHADSMSLDMGSCSCYSEGTWLSRHNDKINRFVASRNTPYEVPGVRDFLGWLAEGIDPRKSDWEIFRFLREHDLRRMVQDLWEAAE